jgi:hypothetical protein
MRFLLPRQFVENAFWDMDFAIAFSEKFRAIRVAKGTPMAKKIETIG